MIEIDHISQHEVRLTPFGELCGPGAMALIRVVTELGSGWLDLEINLRHVPFIDATGLSALATSRRRVNALGGAVHWRDPRPSVRWRIEYCGLGERIGAVAGVEGSDRAESSSGATAPEDPDRSHSLSLPPDCRGRFHRRFLIRDGRRCPISARCAGYKPSPEVARNDIRIAGPGPGPSAERGHRNDDQFVDTEDETCDEVVCGVVSVPTTRRW